MLLREHFNDTRLVGEMCAEWVADFCRRVTDTTSQAYVERTDIRREDDVALKARLTVAYMLLGLTCDRWLAGALRDHIEHIEQERAARRASQATPEPVPFNVRRPA
jgi:hypothetical protein